MIQKNTKKLYQRFFYIYLSLTFKFISAFKQKFVKTHLRSAEKLKQVFCQNGGVFIKVGQHIGGLDYLLPDEYVTTMKQLHNKAPESPLVKLFETVEADLNCNIGDIFERIEPKPIGTASLAQCYKAWLYDGTCVAVKIQHPTVKKNSIVDIKTMNVKLKSFE